jgi:DNA-binding beta-propeller fold protein YncE
MKSLQTATLAIAVSLLVCAPRAGAFTAFESGSVRPLAMSPDGNRLFACNTPDNTLEIFDITVAGLAHVASVAVGLEPVAVAARTDTEVWVVNHLSDSVSIIDLTDVTEARVVRTLLVGDEPRDIVFAGPGGSRAFITTAHRGQNSPVDPKLTEPGEGRADVWVFDANNVGASLGGDEETIITLFGDTPRALAASTDGSKVYAAVFHSGNRTTTLAEGIVPDGGQGAGGLPLPNTNFPQGIPGPETGLIVQFDGSQWVDDIGRDWSAAVRFDLPDQDVFVIDANAGTPVQIAGPSGVYAGVGTILFNMAVNPVTGKVYVSNTEANNLTRFEGPGEFGATTVRGNLHKARITVLDPLGTVTPVHLNKHIDYDACCAHLPNSVNDRSLAQPLEMAVSGDGQTLFVAAFGSGKIGVFSTSELEADTFVPSVDSHVELSGGGPAGIVLDENRGRLYALTRFTNSVSVVNTTLLVEDSSVSLHNPEPRSIVNGRRFLYDARHTSSNGEASCASCHVFGDFDALAWDLGDPSATMLVNPGPFALNVPFIDKNFHPLKGPMTTQTLRGMDNHGPMHWRGDRTGGNSAPSSQPNSGTFDEQAAFKAFNPAFEGLIGRSEVLTASEMQAFTDFILQVMLPPNPIRSLDDTLSPAAAAGRTFYFGPISDTVQNCNGCHTLDPNGNPGVERPGFFGTDGRSSFENEPQFMKVAHLRNVYQKVGMFGMPAVPFVNAGDNGHKGDQIRGFGFLHDGSIDTVFRFFQATVFNQGVGNPTAIPVGAPGNPLRRQLEAFMFEFDTNLKPIVGQQATLTATSGSDVDDRIDLMLAQADAGHCDVVVKGRVAGEPRGAYYIGSGSYVTDRTAEGSVSDATLRAYAGTSGQELTFTAVPPGDGGRIGIDRDGDGFRDADETDAGANPANPLSMPCVASTGVTFRSAKLLDRKGRLTLKGEVAFGEYQRETVEILATDSGGLIFDGGVLGIDFKANKPETVFKYKGAKGVTGISRLTIKEDKKVVGQLKVNAKIVDGWAPATATDTEANTLVILNLGGECYSGNATSVR